MSKVLRITTSLFEESSVSSQLMEALVTGLKEQDQSLELTERNFQEQSIPHLDGEWLTAIMTAEAERSEEQQAKVDFSDALIEEVKAAETLLIALPMYNFSVPSMLKAWVDHIARAGSTFKYTEQGAVGLLQNKKVYFLAAMGGFHQEGESDFLRPYMKQIMSFIGITDVEIISAEGLNVGEEARARGIQLAQDKIKSIVDGLKSEKLGAAA